MTTRDLDRLVSKTELNPVNKQVLREVRKAVMSGRAGDAVIGEADWMIGMVSRGGSGMRFHFSFKKVS
jgi:hypothetical protein